MLKRATRMMARPAPLRACARRAAVATPAWRRPLSGAARKLPESEDHSFRPASERPLAPRRASDVASDDLADAATEASYTLPHPIWRNEYVDGVAITHRPPATFLERVAYNTVRLMRFNFDWMSGYSWRRLNGNRWLERIIFLETVAGVPGSVAATLRHLRSLRRMERDHGWIHTLLEEAENERMHLMTAISIRKPGPLFRGAVWVTQGIFFNFFFAAYIVSPKFCHAFVGYLEEEAVKTYTQLLSEIDRGHLPEFEDMAVPRIALKYWKMPAESTMRDLFSIIRADEAHHREVNHTFAGLDQKTGRNPFPSGY